MFNFFKKNNQIDLQNDSPSFEVELTASVLAYEIAELSER